MIEKLKAEVKKLFPTMNDYQVELFIYGAVKHELDNCNQEPEDCPFCNGMGDFLNSNGDRAYCKDCNGTGVKQ